MAAPKSTAPAGPGSAENPAISNAQHVDRIGLMLCQARGIAVSIADDERLEKCTSLAIYAIDTLLDEAEKALAQI